MAMKIRPVKNNIVSVNRTAKIGIATMAAGNQNHSLWPSPE
jgi:hypothetical protein